MNTIKMRVDLNDARQCRAFALFFNHLAAEPVDQLDKATCNPSKDSPCICPPTERSDGFWVSLKSNPAVPANELDKVIREIANPAENSQPVLEEKTETLEPEKTETLAPEKPKRVRASRAKVVELPTEAPQDPEGKTETATPVTKAIAEIKEVVEPITAEVNAKAATAPKPEAAITVDRLRETIAPLIQKSANNRVTIKNKLADDFGAESLMLLDAAHYDSFYAFLKELQNEG